MDIKEIALKVADSLRNKVDGISHMQSNQGLVRFAEALIESYKAELLKEVGEPVARTVDRDWISTGEGTWLGRIESHLPLDELKSLYTSDQLAAAIAKATKPLEDEVKAANSECELFRKNGRIVDANKIVELRAQLAAAQEANEHWQRATAENENKWIEANDKLTKAEQLWQVAQGRCDGLEEKLSAAQKLITILRKDAETYGPEKISLQKQAWLEADRQRQINELKDQLAKAEQLVAELIPGNGKELSERMKRLATNSVWRYSVDQNKPVDMSDPNIQELFAIIDHLCIGLDSPANGASS